MKKLRSPITWFGGKGRMMAKLLNLMPPHRKYVEVFGGGASLLFAKKPVKIEVYNDLGSGLVGFFRILRDPRQFKKFYRLAQLTPYSREEYYDCRDTWQAEIDPVMRAYKWFVVARQSFSGRFASGWPFGVNQSRRGMAGTVSDWLSTIEMLPEIHQRIMRVQIEHDDFRRRIKTYESPDCLFYLDPPYPHRTRSSGGYAIEMGDSDHEDLLKLIIATPATVMLSSYPNKLYDSYLKGWDKVEFKTACHAAGRTRNSNLQGAGAALKNAPRTEVVWRNSACLSAIGDNGHGRNNYAILWQTR